MLPGKKAGVSWDWASLSPNWTGGFIAKMQGKDVAASAFWTMYDAQAEEGDNIFGHEGTHIWMQRAMGELFLSSHYYNQGAAILTGKSPYWDNWYEQIAYTNPFY